MKLFGIDVQEWSGAIGIITGIFGVIMGSAAVFRLSIINPLKKMIDIVVTEHIEPLTKAIDRNTQSMAVAQAEHKQLGKRIDVAEDRLEDHEGRIRLLEGGEKNEVEK